MPPIRFRSRHLHATFTNQYAAAMTALGWVNAPVNFGTTGIRVIDYIPDERSEPIRHNTTAVSLGDYGLDEDEELGASTGGLRSALYSIFIDVYMVEQSLSLAVCDDIRDIYTDYSMPLINQITNTVVPDTVIEVEAVLGPEKGSTSGVVEQFKRYWRTMRIDGRMYFNADSQ